MTIPKGFRLVPTWALRMATAKGFRERWFYHWAKGGTQIAAYNTTEDEYLDYYGETKYTNFWSFRTSIYHVEKRRSKKNVLAKRLKKLSK